MRIIYTGRNKDNKRRKRVRRRAKIKAGLRAMRLTRNMTPAEESLKNSLTSHNILFIFQKPVVRGQHFRIVDFYFPRKNDVPLVVEVDGGYHQTALQKFRDRQREDFLCRSLGTKILRFTNDEVLKDPEKVTAAIYSHGVQELAVAPLGSDKSIVAEMENT